MSLLEELLHSMSRARTAAHRDGVIAIVLAFLVAFAFPIAASGGTETMTLRWIAVLALLVAGLALRLSQSRPGIVAALVVLLVASFAVHAVWLAALALLFLGDMLAWPLVVAAWRRVFPAEPDRGEEGEAATDVIESIATAFILALVVREFAFEAFKIPTGSMEPTICGDYEGVRRRDRLLEGHSWLEGIAHKFNLPAGDRLLAAKTPLLFGPPNRWQIIVFKYPLFRPTNFIKRLVGLPGEHVEIRSGDIYVDGKIVAKPEEVQEQDWFPMLPDATGEWRGEGVAAEFTADGAGKWTFTTDGAEGSAAADKTSFMVHDAGIADVRASFDLDASKLGAGAVVVRLDGAGRRVELEAKQDGMWLTAPGVDKTKLDVDGLGSSSSRLGFAVADRVARVYRNGRLVARVETADKANISGMGDHVAIGVTGGDVKIAKLKLERDLQYQPAPSDMPADWHVPDDSFFMLGDNTGQSRDSRAWKGRVFRFTDKRPEIVADESTVRLDDDTTIPSVRDEGDSFDVLDSYGVHRKIRKADLEGGVFHIEPRPFVKREDIVGRAFFVFFPFPPFGEWRPRLLP